MPAAEVAAQDAFPYARFDSRGAPFGWRALAASGCSEAAVARLEAYAGANAYRLTSWQSTEIAFHISQALAMAGREEE